jgi:hypothetical protein
MSLLKYVERLKRMDDLISRKATGCAAEFARKLNISQSQLFNELKEMRELGAPIQYCQTRKTYFYENEGELTISFKTSSFIKGGTKLINSNNIRVLKSNIVLGLPIFYNFN